MEEYHIYLTNFQKDGGYISSSISVEAAYESSEEKVEGNYQDFKKYP